MTVNIQGSFPTLPDKPRSKHRHQASYLVFSERYSPGPFLGADVKPPVAGLLFFGCSFHPASELVSVTVLFEDPSLVSALPLLARYP